MSSYLVNIQLNLPRFQFDRAPDVSALMQTVGDMPFTASGNARVPEVAFARFVCSVPLTESELCEALVCLRAAYDRKVSADARRVGLSALLADVLTYGQQVRHPHYGRVPVGSLSLPSTSQLNG